MGMLNDFFKKPKPIITLEDTKELLEIQRKAYMELARNLVIQQAQDKAREDIKIKKADPYA